MLDIIILILHLITQGFEKLSDLFNGTQLVKSGVGVQPWQPDFENELS